MVSYRRCLPALISAMTLVLSCLSTVAEEASSDPIRELQSRAIAEKKSPVAHWGVDPDNYVLWGTHSNRLIPVYTFGTRDAGKGVDLDSYQGENSPYRSESELKRIYGRVPEATLDPKADYLDQTNITDIQLAGAAAGKKYIFLVVFDGMDWETTRAAAIIKANAVRYESGRGTGLHFQDYTAKGTTQFGVMVTSPHNEGTNVDVDSQKVLNPGGVIPGGYNRKWGGPNSWTPGEDPRYIISQAGRLVPKHAYTDSSSSASSMTAGIKTYNNAVNVDASGAAATTIAHRLQEQGFSVGAVTSVPISHATPAAAYAHNVHRNDYQDLTRDLLGLPSIFHPEQPLSGLDVLIGGGFGDDRSKDSGQGKNFVPGNVYLAATDLEKIDVTNGGRYVVSLRQSGKPGKETLQAAAAKAANSGKRLFGFYGVGKYKHLPFATADGDYQPAPGRSGGAEKYTEEDISENPTLADMTTAAITVLSQNPKGFWLMVESGDVDWANHDNNLDCSAGAVFSGDAAVHTITDWVEAHSNWDESLLIVTADHGHYLVLEKPEGLVSDKPTK